MIDFQFLWLVTGILNRLMAVAVCLVVSLNHTFPQLRVFVPLGNRPVITRQATLFPNCCKPSLHLVLLLDVLSTPAETDVHATAGGMRPEYAGIAADGALPFYSSVRRNHCVICHHGKAHLSQIRILLHHEICESGGRPLSS